MNIVVDWFSVVSTDKKVEVVSDNVVSVNVVDVADSVADGTEDVDFDVTGGVSFSSLVTVVASVVVVSSVMVEASNMVVD